MKKIAVIVLFALVTPWYVLAQNADSIEYRNILYRLDKIAIEIDSNQRQLYVATKNLAFAEAKLDSFNYELFKVIDLIKQDSLLNDNNKLFKDSLVFKKMILDFPPIEKYVLEKASRYDNAYFISKKSLATLELILKRKNFLRKKLNLD